MRTIWVLILLAITGAAHSAGEHWTEVLHDGPWRAGDGFGIHDHTATVFLSEIWVVAEDHDSEPSHEVWHTANGVDWTKAPDPPFAPRHGHCAAALGGYLYVVGGSLAEMKDVWRTADGETWELACEREDWWPRGATLTVFDRAMWLIGGDSATGRVDYVFCSVNGTTWERQPDAGCGTKEYHAADVWENRIWLCGGGGTNEDDDVWWMTPFQSWGQAPMIPWPDGVSRGYRYNHTMTAFDDALWVIGGDGAYIGDAWRYTGGAEWEMVFEHAPWGHRASHATVFHDHRLWIIGGRMDENFGDVWVSDAAQSAARTWRAYQ